MHAPCQWLAVIVGTWVIVGAIGRAPPGTDPIVTMVAHSAEVPIIAGDPIIGRYQTAGARFRVTGRGETRRIGALCRGTEDHRFRHDTTEVGPFGQVAGEGPIAQVAIFQGQAIGLILAITGDGNTATATAIALVGHGTWVVVVAGSQIVGELAPPEPVTGIVRTGVGVVAQDGIANAVPGLAVIANGAGITILALATIEDLGGTPRLPAAGIDGTFVAVVA
jgi:hypothetical protein